MIWLILSIWTVSTCLFLAGWAGLCRRNRELDAIIRKDLKNL